jgi:8-oxo-dGTP pyrophosphatase MutT (NUDIX family)
MSGVLNTVLAWHATASAHLFGWVDGQWRVGLIDHPRLRVWMPPGGHVEPYETADEAVLRECEEETGIPGAYLHLVGRPADEPLAPFAPDSMCRPLPLPWWITSEVVGPDSGLKLIHRHIDHHFLVLSQFVRVFPGMGETAFSWFTAAEVAAMPSDRIPEEFRAIALAAFPVLSRLMLSGHPAVAGAAVMAGETQ